MGTRELTHISTGGSGSGGGGSQKGWYRSDAHGGNTSDNPANGWKINSDGSWTDPQGTTYTKDGWIDSQGYLHEANGDIIEPGPFGDDNLVVHPDGTYFDPGLPNGGGTVNPKTGSWVDANGTIHSPSGLTLDQDGNTTSPDGQVQTSGGWTINSDGSWTDPDGNTYYIDGTWTDRDGNLHYTDGTWTDKDGVTHYENGDTSLPGPFGGSYVYHQDGSWTDPDGTQHNSDGTIHTGFSVTPGDTTGDAVDLVTGVGEVGGDDSGTYDTSAVEGDLGTSASSDASDIYDVSPTDDGSSSGDGSSDNNSSNDDHHGDDNTDDQTAAPADPPTPDDGGPTGGSDSDPEGDGEERPGLGHHTRTARGSTPAGHRAADAAGSGDVDNAGGGYGWTHFGAPRSDDGDNGDEKPSLGHHSRRHDSGHGPHLPGSGLQGSTGDSDYVGGGYGWNLHGAPRADTAVPGVGNSAGSVTTGLAGQGISTGGGLTVDSAPLPDGAGPRRRPVRRSRHGRVRLLASAGLLLGLPIGALALTIGGAQPSEAPTTSPVASTTAVAPTSVIVPPSVSMPIPAPLPQPIGQTTPPAPVVTTTQAVPVTTAASTRTPVDETSAAPTTSASAPTATITTTPPRTPIILPPSIIASIPVLPNRHSTPGGSAPRVSTDSAPHNIDGAPRQRTITHHGS